MESASVKRPAWRDYLALTKPIIVILLLVTTLAAMIVAAERWPGSALVFWTLAGGGLTAGGASALNQVLDRQADSKMQRTKHRPLPDGRIAPTDALRYGLILCAGGVLVLAVLVNPLSALLALSGILYYVVFYTMVLKPTTPQNIVVGGGAGAIPTLVGWSAATGSLDMPAFFLFAIVFFWTPSHFWALALLKSQDYARAGVPMFPVIYGERRTRWQIFLYAIQLVALTFLLPLANLGSWFYLLSAAVLGGGLLILSWKVMREGGNRLTWRMYRYSSTYLGLIFAALVIDTLIVA